MGPVARPRGSGKEIAEHDARCPSSDIVDAVFPGAFPHVSRRFPRTFIVATMEAMMMLTLTRCDHAHTQ